MGTVELLGQQNLAATVDALVARCKSSEAERDAALDAQRAAEKERNEWKIEAEMLRSKAESVMNLRHALTEAKHRIEYLEDLKKRAAKARVAKIEQWKVLEGQRDIARVDLARAQNGISCVCYHMDSRHRLEYDTLKSRECNAPGCDCKQFRNAWIALDAAQAHGNELAGQAAAMRESLLAIGGVFKFVWLKVATHGWSREERRQALDALRLYDATLDDTDAGKGWVSPAEHAKVQARVEELEGSVAVLQDVQRGCNCPFALVTPCPVHKPEEYANSVSNLRQRVIGVLRQMEGTSGVSIVDLKRAMDGACAALDLGAPLPAPAVTREFEQVIGVCLSLGAHDRYIAEGRNHGEAYMILLDGVRKALNGEAYMILLDGVRKALKGVAPAPTFEDAIRFVESKVRQHPTLIAPGLVEDMRTELARAIAERALPMKAPEVGGQ